MENSNRFESHAPECRKFAAGVGEKIMLLMIGGSIGAAIALIFAPKRGSELRADIADMTGKRYDEALAAANRLKRRTVDYYNVAKETGNEVLDVVTAGATAVKAEVSSDVEKIGAIVSDSAKRATRESNPLDLAH
jgi:gas vesicle protein